MHVNILYASVINRRPLIKILGIEFKVLDIQVVFQYCLL